MFGGGNQHALPHQAGGITDARDVPPTGRYGEVIQVGADEDNAGRRGSGSDANFHRHAAVQANAGDLDRALDRGFKPQKVAPAFLFILYQPARFSSIFLIRKTLQARYRG